MGNKATEAPPVAVGGKRAEFYIVGTGKPVIEGLK